MECYSGFQVKVVTSDSYITQDSGLMYEDFKVGTGNSPKDGQQVCSSTALQFIQMCLVNVIQVLGVFIKLFVCCVFTVVHLRCVIDKSHFGPLECALICYDWCIE
jgi:hypothetical protein